MIIELPSGKKAKLIGDPHLGRRFETGVPLHRRGEREKKQWQNFEDQLDTPGVEYNIMVGDLFDHPHVGHGTVVKAAEAYLSAAAMNPNVAYFALAGNHDRSRNIETVGAWEAFTKMVKEDIAVVNRPIKAGPDLALFPWEWDRTFFDQTRGFVPPNGAYHDAGVVVGHWDLKSYGGSDDHLVMPEVLGALGWSQLYSGHYHAAGAYEVKGKSIICTGSMEPYSHGEDPEELIYVTRTLDAVMAEPEAYKDKHVRIMLKPGEELPELDCLALTALRDASSEESRERDEVNIAGFDWTAVLKRELVDVDAEVVAFIEERLN